MHTKTDVQLNFLQDVLSCGPVLSWTLESSSTDVFETRTGAGRRMQLLLARFDLNQSVGKLYFKNFKLNATDENQ